MNNYSSEPEIDPRDEIIEQQREEMQYLIDTFNRVSQQLRDELSLYAQRSAKLQNEMMYHISVLKEQISRKQATIQAATTPYPMYDNCKPKLNERTSSKSNKAKPKRKTSHMQANRMQSTSTQQSSSGN